MMVEKMKPSGSAWIGNIPCNWDTSKVKYTFDVINGSTPDSNDFDCWDGEICWITPADMSETGKITSGERNITRKGYNSCGTSLLPQGSIVISTRAPIGKINLTDAKLCTNQGCKSLVKKADNRFFYYLLLAGQDQLVRLGRGTTFVELATNDLKSFGIVIPSFPEQQAIADYLDAQCTKIDSIAADLEKQIELLQKYKKSLITETVTKGLDKSVPMKNSEIEWIGEIPSTWDINRLRYAATIKTGPFGTQLSADEYTPDGVPIINVKNIGYGSILSDDLDYIPESVADRLSEHRLRENDIVFGRKGAVDKHAIISKQHETWVQGSDCIRVRCDNSFDARYLNYLFDSTYFRSHVLLYAVGATMPSMSSEILMNAKVLVPPIEEQVRIADFLEHKCSTIFAVISGKTNELERIKNHKKSLIYEYVTGKKRVKEVRRYGD